MTLLILRQDMLSECPQTCYVFMQIYKEGSLTSEKLRETGVAWKDVFEEIPIHVRNSPLAAAMLACVEPEVMNLLWNLLCFWMPHKQQILIAVFRFFH